MIHRLAAPLRPCRVLSLALLGLLLTTTPPPLHGGAPVPAGAPTAGSMAAGSAAAHEVGQSYIFLRIHQDSIIARVEITSADIELALGLGWDTDAGIGRPQVEAALDRILEHVGAQTRFVSPEGPLEMVFRDFDFRFLEVADYVMLNYRLDGPSAVPDELEVTFPVVFEADPNHRNMLIVEHNWKTATFNSEMVAGIFSPSTPTQNLDLTTSSVWRGFVGLVRLGVWHIWIGFDHILFLMALVLPSVLVIERGKWEAAPGFREAFWKIVTIVTFFTLAHSVTLSLAALDVIRLPSRFVESVIAGSIAVAAWHNLAPSIKVKEATIAFVFGLFHGFGFASVMGDIGLGQDFLVLSLLGFNVGVEIGQVAIIIAVFPVLFLLRRTPLYSPLLRYGSMFLIAVALLWLAERVFDFNVPLGTWARALIG